MMCRNKSDASIIKFKKLTAILVSLAFIIAISGCIESGGGNAKNLLKILPEDVVTFSYYDHKVIKNDEDFNLNSDLLLKVINQFGLTSDDVNYFAEGTSVGMDVVIIGGQFKFKNLEDRLEELNFSKESYMDIIIWTGKYWPYGDYSDQITLIDDKLILGRAGNIKKIIKVVKGESASMYDGNEDVMSRLPDGIIMAIQRNYGDTRNLTYGFTVIKKDENKVKLKKVMEYPHENAAKYTKSGEDRVSLLKDSMKNYGHFSDIDVKRSGKIVEASAKLDIEHLWITSEMYTGIFYITGVERT